MTGSAIEIAGGHHDILNDISHAEVADHVAGFVLEVVKYPEIVL
jgi:hypothetical protein